MTLKKNVVANYLGQGWRALMGLAFIPVYIRYLGVEAYGLIGIFALLQGWLSLLEIGLRPALIREMARFSVGVHEGRSIRDLLRTVEVVVAAAALLVALGIWGASDWLATKWVKAETLSPDVISQAFSFMGVVVALRLVESIYISSVVGLQRQVLENVVSSAMATARGFGVVLVLLFVSSTIHAFFLWQAFVSFATVAVFAYTVYRQLPRASVSGRFSTVALKAIWRVARGTIAIAFLTVLLTQIDKLLLSRLLSLEAFSYYALAGVAAGSLYMLVSPVVTAFYPRFAAHVTTEDQQKLRAVYHQAAQLISVTAGSAAIVLIAVPDRILLLWTGDPNLVLHVAPLLTILAFGTLLNALVWVPYHLQLAYGWTSLTVKVNVVAVVVLVPAILLVVPRYGGIGAAWIWVALNAAYLTLAIYLMHRRLLPDEKRRWYIEDVAAPLFAAGTAGALVRYAIPSSLPTSFEAVTLLLGAACVFAASVLAASTLRSRVLSVSAGVGLGRSPRE